MQIHCIARRGAGKGVHFNSNRLNGVGIVGQKRIENGDLTAFDLLRLADADDSLNDLPAAAVIETVGDGSARFGK